MDVSVSSNNSIADQDKNLKNAHTQTKHMFASLMQMHDEAHTQTWNRYTQ